MKPLLFNVKFLFVLTIVLMFAVVDNIMAGADLIPTFIWIANRPNNNIYHPGDSIDFECRVSNIGDEPSDGYTANFYASGYHIGSENRSGLEPGTADGFTASCSLPEGMPYETYWASVEISCSNDSNPDNNIRQDNWGFTFTEEKPPAPPDLELHVSLSGYTNPYFPGDSLTVRCTVYNIGEVTSDSYTVNVYAGNYSIGSITRNGVVPGDGDYFDIRCSLPYDITEGYYTIRGELSCSNDSNSGNNSDSDRSIRVAMKEPTSVEIQSMDAYGDIFLPGESIVVRIEINGVGGQLENSFKIDVYASLDSIIATSDYKIHSLSSETISPGESRIFIEECRLPIDITPGNYYIGAIVTYKIEDDVKRTQANDAGTVYIGGYSDVVVQSVVITPGKYTPDEEFVVYSLIKNAGQWATGGYTVDYYASSDAVITTDDCHLGYVERDGLAPGEQHSYETTLRIPFRIAAGNYHIGAIITCPIGSDFAENSGCSEETIELVHPAGYVCGQMLYQTREWHQEWPIRYALVEVYDADDNEDPLDNRVIGQTHTDQNGNYGVIIANDEESSQNIYVKVFSECFSGAYPETTGKACSVKDDVFDETYYLQSDLYQDPQDSSVVINMTALADGGEFMVYDSIIEGFEKAKTFFDVNMPEITTHWPCEAETSYFDPCDRSIYIAQGDRGDRDVIMHEYGHFVADVYVFAQGSVGEDPTHFWDADLRHRPRNRTDEEARNLAFREAWASFFSIATQYGDTAYPYAGDTKYQDYDEESGKRLEIDLEKDTKNKRQPGEFYENMNCCALWDIFDDSDDRVDNEDTLSDLTLSKIWTVVRYCQPDDILDFWNGWFQSFDYADEITRIFQAHGMSFVKPDIPITPPRSNSPPVANAGPDQTVEQTYVRGADVRMDASGSYDPDGDRLTYEWYWNDEWALHGRVNEILTIPPGTTTVLLSVSDGQLSDSDAVEITVIPTDPETWIAK
jgi:uncharacterized membrane protein